MTMMDKKADDETISVPKDLYVLNTLAMGVVIQLLAKLNGESIEDWRQYVGSKAGEQYRKLSAKDIQEIIDNLEAARTA
ncbi:hypothetical protein NOS3756_54000 [Nostoc sp. NIES-3756]|uniref:hypothetical protein n=1 Tax=Nostoc sp. NIES-3756 TaxID=1751286 RepID=UPI000722E9DA|nr:hypothetical protein [Nostoc sp. NIES-3756]BAT56395.1 hypothetical protein NOS3756_54000 [Nostoc sp. NIES-3756]